MKYCAILLTFALTVSAHAEAIPAARATALDGHAVEFPRDLRDATILIVGFSQNSANQTTPWERQVRSGLAASNIGFYDMAMLASVPGFVRGLVIRSIRKKVPEVLQPNFLPLTQDEGAWKQAAGFTKDAPDAAYVLLVDKRGDVRWSTHEAWSQNSFARLASEAHKLTTMP